MDYSTDSLAPKTTLQFSKEDFFNQYEMTQILSHLNENPDFAAYAKQSVIHRAMIETKTETANAYEKLMGYVQSKGIDQIIRLIEKREDVTPMNATDVEKIVYRILQEQQTSFISVLKDDIPRTQDSKEPEIPVSDRKKPSSKLKNL